MQEIVHVVGLRMFLRTHMPAMKGAKEEKEGAPKVFQGIWIDVDSFPLAPSPSQLCRFMRCFVLNSTSKIMPRDQMEQVFALELQQASRKTLSMSFSG